MSKWSHAFAEADIQAHTPVPIVPLAPIGRTEGAIGTIGTNGTGVESENEVGDADDADDADLDDAWSERAAIAEYDGKLCCSDAEAVANACHPAPPQPEPSDWVRWFEAEIDRRAFHMPLEAAQTRAMNAALNLWHAHHGSRGEPNRCVGCGGYLPASAAFTLGDGAVIHGGEAFLECLGAYGSRWRHGALEGLRRLGVPISEADI